MRHGAWNGVRGGLVLLGVIACNPDGTPVTHDGGQADSEPATSSTDEGGESGGEVGGDDGGGGGGGGHGGPGPLYRSGTRLKQRILVADDGAEQFVGFWDTTHDFACAFGDDGTGTTRCLPTALAFFTSGYAARYTDTGCSRLLASQDRHCGGFGDTPQAAAESGSCGARYGELHALDGDYTGPLYVVVDGDCVRQGSTSDSPDTRWFRVGASIPLSDLVAATEELR
jgi:hypothetical protein